MYSYILLFLLLLGIIPIFRLIKDQKLLYKVTNRKRGTSSERRLIIELQKMGFSPENIFHDLYVEKYFKNYSQIDAVIVTKVGIIVIEVKDYSGWIFGKGWQEYWTQVLSYGKKKYRFYNPVLQNNGHIKALRQELPELHHIPFYSVIVFYGNCLLKDLSQIPDNTYVTYSERIKQVLISILRNNPSVNYTDKSLTLEKLKQYSDNGADYNIRYQHIINTRRF